MIKTAKEEFAKAKAAGLENILNDIAIAGDIVATELNEKEIIPMPEKEVVTSQISGIEVMDLEDAVTALWKENIYAESGMGCTGPIVMISEENYERAAKILADKKFV